MFEALGMPGQRRPYLLLLFALLMALECLWLRWRGRAGYDWRESAVSTAIAAGNALLRPLTAQLVVLPLLGQAHAHRAFAWRFDGPGDFVLLLLLADLAYYGFHRASHAVRWLWATHSVHHSTRHFNLSAAYRLGWTDLFSGGWLLLLPLVWLGVPPLAAVAAFALNLLFQFFLHTEAVGRLGWLEYVFNTPAHHRLHHASNDGLRDRNFGGVLIVWDRLFGTYAEAPAGTTLRYGGLDPAARHDVLGVVFGEWQRLWRDLRNTRGLRRRLRLAFGRP